MNNRKFPKFLSLAILSGLLLVYTINRAEVPVSRTNKNHSEQVVRAKVNSTSVSQKVSSFKMVTSEETNGVFVGWNIYRFIKTQGASTNGGC